MTKVIATDLYVMEVDYKHKTIYLYTNDCGFCYTSSFINAAKWIKDLEKQFPWRLNPSDYLND